MDRQTDANSTFRLKCAKKEKLLQREERSQSAGSGGQTEMDQPQELLQQDRHGRREQLRPSGERCLASVKNNEDCGCYISCYNLHLSLAEIHLVPA